MLAGVVMPYGETAVLDKKRGIKERFEPGSFANPGGTDVVLNMMHERSVPLSRTGSGGLRLRDSMSRLEMETELPKTRAADDAIELVSTKVLRGLSVEFLPGEYRIEGGDTIVHERGATLRNIGLVDRPAYKGTDVQLRGDSMATKEEIKAMVGEAMEQHRAEKDPPLTAESVGKLISTGIADAFKTRDEEAEKRAKAETAEKRSEAEAEKRGELLASVRVAGLLGKDFTATGKSAKDILVAAAGDEVEDAANRSEGYLERAVEEILERRAEGGTGTGGSKRPPPKGMDKTKPLLRPLNPAQMRAARKGA